MRVLFDINVILDAFLQREPNFEASSSAIKAALANGHFSYISGSNVGDCYYILRKALGSKEKATEAMRDVLSVFHIAPVDQKAVNYALATEGKDFEDDIVTAIAMYGKMECVVTNNISDFDEREIAAYTPKQFLTFLEEGGNLF